MNYSCFFTNVIAPSCLAGLQPCNGPPAKTSASQVRLDLLTNAKLDFTSVDMFLRSPLPPGEVTQCYLTFDQYQGKYELITKCNDVGILSAVRCNDTENFVISVSKHIRYDNDSDSTKQNEDDPKKLRLDIGSLKRHGGQSHYTLFSKTTRKATKQVLSGIHIQRHTRRSRTVHLVLPYIPNLETSGEFYLFMGDKSPSGTYPVRFRHLLSPLQAFGFAVSIAEADVSPICFYVNKFRTN